MSSKPAAEICNRPALPRPAIAALLALVLAFAGAVPCGAAPAAWPDEYRSGDFWCHADFPLAPYHALLNTLPMQQREVLETLRLPATGEPIHVFLFRQRGTYQRYLQQFFPDVPSRKALFIKGVNTPGMVFVYLNSDFETDLRHECTHAILNAALPMVPLWLDEGLAEYFEVPAADRPAGNPHHRLVKFNALLAPVPKIETLESLRELSQMGRNHYRHAWSWTHFMIHGPPAAVAELHAFLADIRMLTPPGRLSERLRRRLPDLEREFAQHFRTWRP